MSAPPAKRRRSQLSCDECKQRKVACDRQWPCTRCTRNTRTCAYSTKHITNDNAALIDQLARHPNSVNILSSLQSKLGMPSPGLPSPAYSVHESPEPLAVDLVAFEEEMIDAKPPTTSLYEHHFLFRFFNDIPELYSYAHKIVTHLGHAAAMKKIKPTVCTTPSQLEILDLFSIFTTRIPYDVLPDGFDPLQTTTEESRMLLLGIMSCATPFGESHLQSPFYWIQDIDRWLRRKRDVMWYRVAIVAYLAKRIHCLEKKRYWEASGALYRAARMDNLKQKSPELWSIVCELDVQASMEFGMPTLVMDGSIELEVCNALLSPDDRPQSTIDETKTSVLSLTQRLDPHRHAKHIIMLNRRKTDWLSRSVVEQTSKMVLRADEDIFGCDYFLAAFSLVHLALRQEVSDHNEVLQLLQKALAASKRRYLHTCVGEPWCVLSMLAAIAILSAHWKLMPSNQLLETACQHFQDVYNARAVDTDLWDWTSWLETAEF